jgi:hypothetical protein
LLHIIDDIQGSTKGYATSRTKGCSFEQTLYFSKEKRKKEKERNDQTI